MSAAGDRILATEILKILERAKVFILDFDGTLVDSNMIKVTAFEKCFVDYSEHFDPVMEYCRGNNHIPRQVKFRHVFENILKLPYTAEIEKHLLERYAAETTEQVIQAKEIPGATSFLKRFAGRKELVLLSSTPQDFLEIILEKRGMRRYFSVVQGAPVHKASWLKQFLKEGGWGSQEAVFVGDSEEDFLSAKEAAVLFVGLGETLSSRAKYHIETFETIF